VVAFGSIGLYLTMLAIYKLVVGDNGSGPLFVIAALLIIIAAKALKKSSQSYSINPLDSTAAAEASKVASRFSPLDRKLLDQVKADMLTAPSLDKILDVLNKKNNDWVKLANPALQRIAFAFKPTFASNYAKGLIFEIFIWAYVLFTFGLEVASGRISPSLWNRDGVFYNALRQRRRAKRYRLKPYKVFQRDSRAPVLYLRSFSDDYEDNLENYFPRTSEEKIAAEYSRYGPVIAVGAPTEDLSLLGASRVYFDTSTWKAGVLYLMSISQLVIVEAGCARGALWELGMARQRLELSRLIISFAGWGNSMNGNAI
jgi:hypothetical protein